MQIGVQLRRNFGNTVLERLGVVQQAGISVVEIDGRDLIDSFKDIRTHCKATETVITTACGGYRGWIGHFDKNLRKQALSDIKEILSRCAEIGAQGIVVPAAYGMFSTRLNAKTAPRTAQEDESVLTGSLRELDEHARSTGSTVFLEPLNRYEDHMVNTLDQAAALIEGGEYQNVKIAADTFHMNIEEPNIPFSIQRWRHLVGHIHLADTNRFEPGQGHFNFSGLFKTLRDMNYLGSIVIESSWSGDLECSIRRSLRYLENLLMDNTGWDLVSGNKR